MPSFILGLNKEMTLSDADAEIYNCTYLAEVVLNSTWFVCSSTFCWISAAKPAVVAL